VADVTAKVEAVVVSAVEVVKAVTKADQENNLHLLKRKENVTA
jgi:hypothetical protein